MLKKIRRITIIVSIIFILIVIIGIVFFLNDAGLIDLGDTNSTDSSISGTVTDADVKQVMAMSDEEVWKGLTNGLLSDRPSDRSPANASQIESTVRQQMVDITVPTRAWENAGDSSNMNIVRKDVTVQVNKLLAGLWTAFFTDLYNEAPNFVIKSVGVFRIDGTGYGQIGYKSGHTYGAAVDINWYGDGNPYGTKPAYSKEEWNALPENHLKYQIIYKDSDVVKIAHKYTLYWGGEWTGKNKDIMHFSFVCDGKSRADRIQMYGN